MLDVLAAHGEVPLPPYITHAPEADDESRYQTVYARVPGAVAAPTAGLHFDEAMLAALAARGIASARVTLHVGAGTFQPVRGDDISSHVMHAEWYSIPEATVSAIAAARARGGRVVAVGTTTLRALESAAAARDAARAGRRDAALHRPGLPVPRGRPPGHQLPPAEIDAAHARLRVLGHRTSSAAPMPTRWRERYRFFSYGDAMLLDRCGV